MTKPNKMTCAPIKDSDQPMHSPSLIRIFAVSMKKHWALNYLLSAQWRLWSDWADAQADLSFHWAHTPFCWFCFVAAHVFWMKPETRRDIFRFPGNLIIAHWSIDVEYFCWVLFVLFCIIHSWSSRCVVLPLNWAKKSHIMRKPVSGSSETDEGIWG